MQLLASYAAAVAAATLLDQCTVCLMAVLSLFVNTCPFCSVTASSACKTQPTVVVTNGIWRCPSVTIGQTCTVTCNSGYLTSDHLTLTCSSASTWWPSSLSGACLKAGAWNNKARRCDGVLHLTSITDTAWSTSLFTAWWPTLSCTAWSKSSCTA